MVYAGGLVGCIKEAGAEIVNCYNAGDMIVPKYAPQFYLGGLVGSVSNAPSDDCSKILRSYNTGNIMIVGTEPVSEDTFTDSFSLILNVGGVIGKNYGLIEDVYNTGNITMKDTCFNEIALVTSHRLNIGGIVGTMESNTMLNCYNQGDIESVNPHMRELKQSIPVKS